jgi:predicted N-acetyltransferase YhbS
MKSPKIILRLLRGLRFRGNTPPCSIEPLGALLSTAVSPDSQGLGLPIALMRSVCDEYVRRGIDAIFLTTDAEHNDRVRGFYAAMGWDLLGHYVTPEQRKMCWYLWQNPEKEKKTFTAVNS